MKKRLLITSIVMMLVVAVALSTATYAWFTSATTVTANSITMTAGTSQSTALGIQWNSPAPQTNFNANYSTFIVSLEPSTSQAGGFQPAAPAALTDAEPTFHTAYINAQGDFMSTPGATTTDVYRFKNYADSATATAASQTYSDLIHVANLAQSGSVSVYLTASITAPLVAIGESEASDTATYDYYDENKALIPSASVPASVSTGYKATKATTGTAVDMIRIAVFEVASTSYTYKGVLSKTAATSGVKNTAVGTITAGNSAAALVSSTGVESATELSLGSLTAQNEKTYAVYVWLDGALFDESRANNSASVSLTFSTASVGA